MIRGLMSDVHGVLYTHPRALPGSVEAVRRLVEAGFPHVFLTNSTQFPRSWILRTLREMGFALEDRELLTAAQAAGGVLAERGWRRIGWLAVPELAEDLPEAVPVLPESDDAGPVDAVLVGDIGDRFTYRSLNRAFRWLQEGAALIGLARNRYYQTQAGLTLDSGPFLKLLEEAAESEALVVGKPSPAFFRAGLRRLGVPAGEAAMVGDDLAADVHPAMDLGLTGIQVRTGKFRPGSYRAAARRADLLVDDLAAAVDWLLGAQTRD